jgi:hypothetical protein
MTRIPGEHVGSAIDKPDPKTLFESVGDSLKSVLSTKSAQEVVSPTDTKNGTVQRITK